MLSLKTILNDSLANKEETYRCWENGFEITFLNRNVGTYWEPYYGESEIEQLDVFALLSYTRALEDGWDPNTPLPDHYELYDSPENQPIYLEHLRTKGVVFLERIRVHQKDSLIEIFYHYTQEIDPFGKKKRLPHHQRRLRFDLEKRVLYSSVPFEENGAWKQFNQELYLFDHDESCSITQVYGEYKILQQHLSYFQSQGFSKLLFRGVSYLIRNFHLKKYPLPQTKQVLFDQPLKENLVGCLIQMHLIHYHSRQFTSELLNDWVFKTPAQLLTQYGLKPNSVFQELLIQSLDHLFSICYLKKEGFSTHEISLLLKNNQSGSDWMIRIMERAWVKQLLRNQGRKEFARHWFRSGKGVIQLVKDIDRTYSRLAEGLPSESFEEIKSTWNYRVSLKRFEKQLLETLPYCESIIIQEPFRFQTPWVRQIFDSGRCLAEQDSLRLMIPENELELMQKGVQYRMCFSNYIQEIRKESEFIFFVYTLGNKFKGAIRLMKSLDGWEIVEVKQTYNKTPSLDFINWIQSINQEYGWKWNCPDIPDSLAMN